MGAFQNILKKLGLIFVEETHKYFIADREIPSATGIISTVMGNPFVKDTLYMRVARDRGTLLHKVISEFVIDGKEPDLRFPEFNNFLKLSNEHNLTWTLSEQMIYNDIGGMEYAGTLDLFALTSEEITDVKTGSTKQLKKWQMQLSMYAQALRDIFGMKVSRGSVFWLHNEIGEYIPIELLSKEAIRDILMKYYYPNMNNNQEQEISLKCLNSNAIAELNETLTAIEVMEKKIKGVKEKILKEMEERQINQIKIGNRVISYVPASFRESVDSKKLKEDFPEIWRRCRKETKVNSSIRIK